MQALTKKFQRFRLSQQASTIPLNQQQYLADFADRDSVPAATTPTTGKDAQENKPPGPYLTEVLAIASDYLRLLTEEKITIDSKPAE